MQHNDGKHIPPVVLIQLAGLLFPLALVVSFVFGQRALLLLLGVSWILLSASLALFDFAQPILATLANLGWPMARWQLEHVALRQRVRRRLWAFVPLGFALVLAAIVGTGWWFTSTLTVAFVLAISATLWNSVDTLRELWRDGRATASDVER